MEDRASGTVTRGWAWATPGTTLAARRGGRHRESPGQIGERLGQFGRPENVGYLTANTVNIAINPNFPRPLFYAAISGGYNILGSLLVSVLLLALQ
ncbi:hypothetical protein [Actinoplanes sp. NPDC026619]|uniref:hypothetical protein n=1 Tax=Actinoplanes sp. NPDC026619 TaxID=3155798 RepID=UPI0033F17653